jgi:hypothetical protein
MPKISELPAASSVDSADLIVISQGDVTKKATVSLLPAGSAPSTVELGGTTDTTLSRLAAGKLGVEGKAAIKHTGSYTSGEVTFSTSDPSGGSSGDIWFKYTA